MGSSRTLRLGYLVPEFPSQTHIFFWREAEALRQLGVEVRWLSTRRPKASCPHAFGAPAAAATHYVFPPRLGPALRRLAPGRGVARALAYLAQLHESPPAKRILRLGAVACAADLADFASRHRIDHLHVHSCAEAAHLAALTQRLSGLPYSLTLHGDLPVYGRDHAAKMANARFVSVVTHDLQRQVMRQVGLSSQRLPVIRMGVDTDFFAPRQEGAASGAFHFVTVARLSVVKGHRFALLALRELLDSGIEARYSIAGGGPDAAAIAREVSSLGLESSVRFVGSLPEADVLALLRSADAFVLPSFGLGEAAPVAVMEAMAAGLPVVCSIIGGVPELVSDGTEGFLIQQQDEAGLAASLRRLAQDAALRGRMGRAARERAVAEFDSRRGAAALLERIRAAQDDEPAPSARRHAR